MSKEAREVAYVVLVIAAAIWLVFYTLHWLMSDRLYTGGEASAQCGAAGKTVGKYEYSYGRTNFTCENAP